jgi:hypothetical protein
LIYLEDTTMTKTNEMPKIASYPLFQEKIPGMPEADIDWLGAQIADFWSKPENEDYDNTDNNRIAIKDDPTSCAVYDDDAGNGCCGSCDVEFGPSPSGRTYLYGFNYGH